jgi:NhaA family Na+:H+ antiporter
MAQAGTSALRRFLDNEATGGMLLIGAAALALVAANSGLARPYRDLLDAAAGPFTVQLWINDALMAFFFLLVGLEIKREFLDGNLASWERRRLPLLAAASGMAVPALVYLAVARGDAMLARGWAIPAATDIAFAIGVLALLGSRAPASLKLFLTTVAIADDLGAVAIIATVYSDALNLAALAAAGAVTAALWGLGRIGVTLLPVYLIGAVLLWYMVLLSGIHPTIAGVLAAAAIPLVRTTGAPDAQDARHSPLHRLEHGLSPWVAFAILPLFGFANAGVALGGAGAGAWLAPLPLAIALGLFAGKQAGIFGAVRLSVGLGWASRPRGATWLQIYGIALLCGIGFTMSLFIASLAFPGRPILAEQARIGILLGSFLSALAGWLVLRFAPPSRAPILAAADGDLADLEAAAQAIDLAAKSNATSQEKLVLGPRDP